MTLLQILNYAVYQHTFVYIADSWCKACHLFTLGLCGWEQKSFCSIDFKQRTEFKMSLYIWAPLTMLTRPLNKITNQRWLTYVTCVRETMSLNFDALTNWIGFVDLAYYYNVPCKFTRVIPVYLKDFCHNQPNCCTAVYCTTWLWGTCISLGNSKIWG